MRITASGLQGKLTGQGGVDATLEVDGSLIAVLGPSGAGKSTLLALLATAIPPSGGAATLGGIEIRKQAEIRKRTGYLKQGACLPGQMTVKDALELSALLQGMDHAPARGLRIQRALERFGLEYCASSRIESLDAAQQRLALLAQAALGQPLCLIVDAPLDGLGPEASVAIGETLRRFSSDCPVMMSTDRAQDAAAADAMIILLGGTVAFSGSVSDLLAAVPVPVWLCPFTGDFTSVQAPASRLVVRADGKFLRLFATEPPPESEPVTLDLGDAYAWVCHAAASPVTTQQNANA